MLFALRQLFWKHCRETWSLWLILMVGNSVCLWLQILTQPDYQRAAHSYRIIAVSLAGISMGLAGVTAIGTVILNITNEQRNRTDVRLVQLGALPIPFITSILSSAVVGSSLVCLVGLLNQKMLFALGHVTGLTAKEHFASVILLGHYVIPVSVASLTAATLARTTLRSIALSGVLGTMAIGPMVGSFGAQYDGVTSIDVRGLIASWCMTAILFPFMMYSVKRWCRRPCLAGSGMTRDTGASGMFRSILRSVAGASLRIELRQFLAIVWKELFEARWFALFLSGFLLAGLTIGVNKWRGPFWGMFQSYSLIFATLCGTIAYRSEMGDKVRFYSERGIGWRPFWLARTVVWLGFVSLFVGAIGLWFTLTQSTVYLSLLEHVDEPWSVWMGVLSLIATAFFLGQFAALQSRSLMHSLGLAGVFTATMMVWASVLSTLKIHPGLGLAPILIAAFLSVILTLRSWMNLQTQSAGKFISLALIGLGGISCWVFPALFYLQSLPDPPAQVTLSDVEQGDRDLLLPGCRPTAIIQTTEDQRRLFGAMSALGPFPGWPKIDRKIDVKALLWFNRNKSFVEPAMEYLQGHPRERLGPKVHHLLVLETARLASTGQNDEAVRIAVAVATADPRSEGYASKFIASLACSYPANPSAIERAREGVLKLRDSVEWYSTESKRLTVERGGRQGFRNGPRNRFLGLFGGPIVLNKAKTLYYGLRNEEYAETRRLLRSEEPCEPYFMKRDKELRLLAKDLEWLDSFSRYANDFIASMPAQEEVYTVQKMREAMCLLEACEALSETGRLPTQSRHKDPMTGKPARWSIARFSMAWTDKEAWPSSEDAMSLPDRVVKAFKNARPSDE